jgi:hypothetical protein
MINAKAVEEKYGKEYRLMKAEDVVNMFYALDSSMKWVMKNGMLAERGSCTGKSTKSDEEIIDGIKGSASYIKNFLARYEYALYNGRNLIDSLDRIINNKSVRAKHYIDLYDKLMEDLWYVYENTKSDFNVKYTPKKDEYTHNELIMKKRDSE